MSVKPEGFLGDIKIANVFHHPVKAQNLNLNSNIYTPQPLYNTIVGVHSINLVS